MKSVKTDYLFWHNNPEWYVYDEETDMFSLTEKAPQEAIESFELWKQLNNL